MLQQVEWECPFECGFVSSDPMVLSNHLKSNFQRHLELADELENEVNKRRDTLTSKKVKSTHVNPNTIKVNHSFSEC
jgi:hypothetical protein